MIEELRQMGNEAQTARAEHLEWRKQTVLGQSGAGIGDRVSKTVWVYHLGIPDQGDGTALAERYERIERPFSAVAGVSCRGVHSPCSK
ncbi:MAG: hypothetical protein IPL99_26220 [Candidatus Competibacteraceae bacterium]|nr:hypothetical protein [Candidatus Competibacteraceae bacterium]